MKSKDSSEEVFILQKLIEGDEDALKYFFDTYYDDLCNFVNSYIQSETFSEDIVQGIFIDLWEKKSSLQKDRPIKSYLYSASKNKSLNHLRNKKVQNKVIDRLKHKIFQTSEGADQYLEFEELKQVLSNAIDNLPSQCKTIYQLSRNDSLSNKEIAHKLGISSKTVENQITIAIKKIKVFLNPYYDKIFIFYVLTKFF